MQVLPLVGFFWRRNKQIAALLEAGQSSDKSSHIVLDVANAAAPLLHRYFPELNEDGLLDDALTTLKEAFAPAPNISIPVADQSGAANAGG